MVLIVKMIQSELVAFARTRRVSASIGPTSPGGWTAAWWEDGAEFDTADLAGLGISYLDVDDTDDGMAIYLQIGDGAREHRVVWPDGEPPAGPVAAAATSLAVLFGRPDQATAVETVLRRDAEWCEDLMDALAEVVEMPLLHEPPPPQAVVVLKGSPELARIAARVAGPAAVDGGVDGWTTVLPTGPVHEDSGNPAWSLAAGLSAAAKRAPVLLFWRDGQQCGVLVWRRGQVQEIHAWNETWLPTLDDEPASAAALITATGPADPSMVRALARRKPPDGDVLPDPLPELVSLLGLPSTVLTALDHPASFRSSAPEIELTSARQAVIQHLREYESPLPRPIRIGYAVLTGLAALVCALMTLLSAMVLATDGEFVDQDGAGGGDWVWLGVFAALTVILTLTARTRWRATRRITR